ncbi:hypothetical protein C5167_049825 [Papaver somniferum]|uniref:Uncharacterized protein n=1 Tax=Papaver somniferum TaxID=3469 RepID=A0A4Y7KNA3_PAPSO|nr:hypothetical protein C5167_049825 [Papaver somniferum]
MLRRSYKKLMSRSREGVEDRLKGCTIKKDRIRKYALPRKGSYLCTRCCKREIVTPTMVQVHKDYFRLSVLDMLLNQNVHKTRSKAEIKVYALCATVLWSALMQSKEGEINTTIMAPCNK